MINMLLPHISPKFKKSCNFVEAPPFDEITKQTEDSRTKPNLPKTEALV